MPSDAEPIRRARTGDRAAFIAIIREHDARLRALVFKLLAGDLERTERVLIDVYTNAFKAHESIPERTGLATWLYRRAYNACLDELRRIRPHAHDGPGTPEGADGLQPALAGLRALPVSQRVTLVLIDAEGFSLSSAASILGVPADRVQVRLEHARDTMHHHLTPRSA